MDGLFHYWPHPAQLPAVHPPQDDEDEPTVWPPAPLLTNPHVDMSLQTLALWQSGQAGTSWPNTSFSN
jgi:hypothetical protein